MNSGYHEVRLTEDPKRKILWGELARYFSTYIPSKGAVLDFGAGYCDFINNISAGKKIAYDIWDGIKKHADPDVTCVVGDSSSFEGLIKLDSESLDVIFASNIFEHFSLDELDQLVPILRSKLKVGGRLIALQPNYYYAYRNYFDDYTHKSIWTHTSFSDYISSNGFSTLKVEPKFMPLTVKSRFPVHRYLIRLYLASPFKPLSGQMLLIFKRLS